MGNTRGIILIGMPGSGKSTIGRILAEKTGARFVDTDDLVTGACGCLLHVLLKQEGPQGFLRREEEAIVSFCRQEHPEKLVIATGGSVVYEAGAMEALKQLGPVVYLQVSLQELAARLGDLQLRGVVCGQGETLSALYAERVPLYERWGDWVLPEDASPEELAERLAARWRDGERKKEE